MKLPVRYRALKSLGAGGAGSVWAVQDRVTGERLALKLVHEGASHGELDALVREASALAALSQAGLPGVRAIGTLPGTSRRYLVRELVEGKSLEDALDEETPWLGAFVTACAQLALLHRAGSLHGDIKPANLIVRKDGRGCLVDLGLSAPLMLGGTRTLGLTPRFAAPELLEGERLTVRAEVYSLGATLRDAIARRGDELKDELRIGLTRAVHRATLLAPAGRHPSVDEFYAEITSLPGVSIPPTPRPLVWRVGGLEETVRQLTAAVHDLAPGQSLVLVGPEGAGRSTLLRELAWTLAAAAEDVVHIAAAPSDKALEVHAEEMDERPHALLLIDDYDAMSDDNRRFFEQAASGGRRRVLVMSAEHLPQQGNFLRFDVPVLDSSTLEGLVRAAIPSVSRTAVVAMLDHAAGRPAPLHELVLRCASDAMVGREDVERAKLADAPLGESDQAYWIERLSSALYSGRFATARVALTELERRAPQSHAFECAIAEVRIRVAQGDNHGAGEWLKTAEQHAKTDAEKSELMLYTARLSLRRGDYEQTAAYETEAQERGLLSFELRVVAALARAMIKASPENVRALRELNEQLDGDSSARARGIALVSLALAEQRAGDMESARAHYAMALVSAEEAGDGWTLCSTYVNSASHAQLMGELGESVRLLEAATDLAERLGADLAAYTATLNLVALDLHLGRYERAAEGIRHLEEYALPPYALAQLQGLRAELAERGLAYAEASESYARCVAGFMAVGMHADAYEAELLKLCCDARRDDVSAATLSARLLEIEQSYAELRASEHMALRAYAEAWVALRHAGVTEGARAFAKAADVARTSDTKDVLWLALLGLARAHREAGAPALAHRAATEALESLEGMAAALPRDLCEVFWNDARRRELRDFAPAATSMSVRATDQTWAAPGTTALQHLMQSSRALTRVHEPARVLVETLEHAVAISGATRGLLYYRDPLGRPEWVCPYSFEPEQLKQAKERLERTVDTAETTIEPSSSRSPAVMCLPIPRSAMRGGLSTTVGSLTHGAIYLETTESGARRFSEMAPVVAALLAHASVVLDTARLVERLKRQKERVSELLDKRSKSLHSVRAELRAVRTELKETQGFAGMVGGSKAMRSLYDGIRRVADADVPVLIIGESGTGKELVARALHEQSSRSKLPFVALNCAAVPASVLEGELFGYRKGAFTGADRDHQGLLLAAGEGTLFLDEVGDMPLNMQAALLRVLQERVVRPLGSSEERPLRARIIAATHRDLAQMVAEGTFRQDLYYRLEVVSLHVPPLRERREDIALLADSFLRRASVAYKRPRKTLSRSAREALHTAAWPGNVRQLEHALTSAVLLTDDETLHASDLSLVRPSAEGTARGAVAAGTRDLGGAGDKERFVDALRRANGNRVRAAEMLGIPRRTFYRRLAELGIGPKAGVRGGE